MATLLAGAAIGPSVAPASAQTPRATATPVERLPTYDKPAGQDGPDGPLPTYSTPVPAPTYPTAVPATSRQATATATRPARPTATVKAAPPVWNPQMTDYCALDVAGFYDEFTTQVRFYDSDDFGHGVHVGPLQLNADCTWSFMLLSGEGTSGYWSVDEIQPSDWQRWQLGMDKNAYQKVIFTNWGGEMADGPVGQPYGFGGRRDVEYLWVVFPAVPPAIVHPGLSLVQYEKTDDPGTGIITSSS